MPLQFNQLRSMTCGHFSRKSNASHQASKLRRFFQPRTALRAFPYWNRCFAMRRYWKSTARKATMAEIMDSEASTGSHPEHAINEIAPERVAPASATGRDHRGSTSHSVLRRHRVDVFVQDPE